MLYILTEPFFQRALLAGAMIALMAPLMGVFVVLRRLSMIGDSLAHVSIAGVALGFLINVYPLALGLLFAVAAAFAIEKLRRSYKSYAELSIAIIMSGGIAAASLLFTMGKGFNMNVSSYLFGSIFFLSSQDLWLIFAVTVIVIAVVFLFLKEMFLITFDEDTASVNGLPLRYFNVTMTILTALVISVAIKIVGALLVSAVLTIPVSCSLAVSRSFKHTVWLAVAYAQCGMLGGLLIAGIWNLAPGGSVVILLVILLILTLAGKKGAAK
jgi:zinc transport system permease protein